MRLTLVLLRRAITALKAIGNATRWFDCSIYAYGVSYIGSDLPGRRSPGDAVGVGDVRSVNVRRLRPLGGFVWGPLGGRVGRKHVLTSPSS